MFSARALLESFGLGRFYDYSIFAGFRASFMATNKARDD
jgi:hypothetical protein